MMNRAEKHDTLWQERWKSLAANDANVGFIYGVKTTGIYCRVGCASRLPKPQNVLFFDTAAQAAEAGLRPCKRCRPDAQVTHPHLNGIQHACRLIEQSEQEPSLAQLADAAAMSMFHFQRVFKSLLGLTPKQYAKALRAGRFQQTIGSSATVTEALFNSGWNTLSRGYDEINGRLGMRPRDYLRGGKNRHVRYGLTKTTLGWLLVAATGQGVCMIALDDSRGVLEEQLQKRFPHAEMSQAEEDFNEWIKEVAQLVEQPAATSALPLDIRGTAFQECVWQALKAIPAGSTVSYGELAAIIGKPKAVRAVASACGANPVAVAIPCHRVLGSDGALHGYRWGVERKKALLERER